MQATKSANRPRAHAAADRNLVAGASVLSCESTVPVVLVIDDEDRTRMGLKRSLEANGFAVIAAENGVRGLQAFRNVRPALVLVDAEMPKLDGRETIKQMRREWNDAKIVMMTGECDEVHRGLADSASEIDASECVKKPINSKQLLRTLWQLLGQTALPPRNSGR